jgi:hypothetical protein
VITFGRAHEASGAGRRAGFDPLANPIELASAAPAPLASGPDATADPQAAHRPAAKRGKNKGATRHAAGDSPRRDSADIVLTSTILGSSRRAAVINGRLYREGDRLVLSGDTFKLASVAENRIELQHDRKKTGRRTRVIVRTIPAEAAAETVAAPGAAGLP